MRTFFSLFGLQLFAESVSGESVAAQAAAGETAVDAGQQTGVRHADAGHESTQARSLEELGVPRAKAERYRAIKERQGAPAQPATAEPAAESVQNAPTEQDAAAAESRKPESETNAAETAEPNWDELKKNPIINRKMQETVRASKKPLQDKLDSLTPLLELLGRYYGMDTSDMSKLDIAGLARAVGEDDRFYQDEALERGEDVSTTKQRTQRELELNAKDRAISRRENELSSTIEEMMARRHQEKLEREADELKKLIPEFDLEAERAANPRFAAMITASGGLSVADAYAAFHRREYEEAVARKVTQAYSNSIQYGRSVPAENGGRGRGAAATPGSSTSLEALGVPKAAAERYYRIKNNRGSR